MSTDSTWQVGDEYYQAECLLNGLPHDIEASPCLTEGEASAQLKTWLSFLSERERRGAGGCVRKYRILAVTGGEITAVTID